MEFLQNPIAKNHLYSNNNINNYYIDFTYNNYIDIFTKLFNYDMYKYIILNNNDVLLDHFIDIWNNENFQIWNDENIVVQLVENPSDKIVDLINEDLINMYSNNNSFWFGLSTNTNIKAINILKVYFDNYINIFLDEDGLFIMDNENIRFFGLFLKNPTAIDLIWENWDYLNMISDNNIIINLLAKNPHNKAIEYIINEWNIINKDNLFWENLAYNNNNKAIKLIVDNWRNINKSIKFWEMLALNTNDKALQLITDNLSNIKSNVGVWLSLVENTNISAFNFILENWNYIMDIMDNELYLFFISFITYQPVFEIDVEKTNLQKDELNIIYNKIQSYIF
jgi:hypothetical protein